MGKKKRETNITYDTKTHANIRIRLLSWTYVNITNYGDKIDSECGAKHCLVGYPWQIMHPYVSSLDRMKHATLWMILGVRSSCSHE